MDSVNFFLFLHKLYILHYSYWDLVGFSTHWNFESIQIIKAQIKQILLYLYKTIFCIYKPFFAFLDSLWCIYWSKIEHSAINKRCWYSSSIFYFVSFLFKHHLEMNDLYITVSGFSVLIRKYISYFYITLKPWYRVTRFLVWCFHKIILHVRSFYIDNR